MTGIPDQLLDAPLIRLRPNSKRPVVDAYEVEPIEYIRKWLDDGGNVGVSLLGDLIAIDADDDRFADAAEETLPPTFTVETGGGGEHRYYRCEGWDSNRTLSDLGEIRSDGWQVAAPPSIHPNGRRYRVIEDRPIAEVEPAALEKLLAEVSDRPWYQNASTGSTNTSPARRRRPGVGGAAAPIPEQYPNRPAEWSTLKKWLARQPKDLLGWLSASSSDDWSGREFTLCKCLAEGGFAPEAIADALYRIHPNAKWHRGTDELSPEEYQQLTIQKAIEAAVDDPHVSFAETGDMASSEAESRKTEPDGGAVRNQPEKGESQEVNAMPGPEFTDKDEVVVQKPDPAKGNTDFRKLVLVEGYDEEDDRTFEYVALKRGYVEEGETMEGEPGFFERVTDSSSLGSPDDIEGMIRGLAELNEVVNGVPVEVAVGEAAES